MLWEEYHMEHKEMTYTAAQHEREMTRIEIQSAKRLYALLFVLALLFISNIGWVVYEFVLK